MNDVPFGGREAESALCAPASRTPRADGRRARRRAGGVRENAPQLGNLLRDFRFTGAPRRPLVLPTTGAPNT
jgi:hypothetical protein